MSDIHPIELNKRLRIILNKELVRRLILQYFDNRGYAPDEKIYPPVAADLVAQVPQLANKIEVVPYIENINPMMSIVKIGWNLFVLGNKRMDLGYSTHTNMADFKRSLRGQVSGLSGHESRYTPSEIAKFVADLLSTTRDGAIDKMPPGTTTPSPSSLVGDGGVNRPSIGPTASGGYYERNRPVN